MEPTRGDVVIEMGGVADPAELLTVGQIRRQQDPDVIAMPPASILAGHGHEPAARPDLHGLGGLMPRPSPRLLVQLAAKDRSLAERSLHVRLGAAGQIGEPTLGVDTEQQHAQLATALDKTGGDRRRRRGAQRDIGHLARHACWANRLLEPLRS